MLALLLSAVFLGGLFALAWVLGRTKTQTGTLQFKRKYPYEIGNYLTASDRVFAGLTVTLPKRLPHLYLDHRKDSQFAGPTQTYANRQRIDLEGDFNKYFQLFCPQGYQVLALSILTPEVMQMLQHTTSRYDVEIKHDRLNVIIGGHSRFLKPQTVKELERVARAIVKELDHKMSSWSTSDEAEAAKTELVSYNEQSVRVFGAYMGIGIFTSLVGLLVSLPLYYLMHYYSQKGSDAQFIYGTLAGAAFPVLPLTIYFAKHSKEDSGWD